MNLPLPSGFSTFDGVAAWARRIVPSIATSWGVEHRPNGTHRFSWVDVPYAATNFRGGGTMSWGVGPGDQKVLAYRIAGDSCLFAWRLTTTDVGGGNARLLIQLPEGVRPSRVIAGTHYYDDAGTEGIGLARVTANLTHIELFKFSTAANWTATAADNTYTEGSLEFSITR